MTPTSLIDYSVPTSTMMPFASDTTDISVQSTVSVWAGYPTNLSNGQKSTLPGAKPFFSYPRSQRSSDSSSKATNSGQWARFQRLTRSTITLQQPRVIITPALAKGPRPRSPPLSSSPLETFPLTSPGFIAASTPAWSRSSSVSTN